jgi:hypothetical protein
LKRQERQDDCGQYPALRVLARPNIPRQVAKENFSHDGTMGESSRREAPFGSSIARLRRAGSLSAVICHRPIV